jgi:hypothetical protein
VARNGRQRAVAPWLRAAAWIDGAEVFLFVIFGLFFYKIFRPLHVARAWASWGEVGCTVPHFLKHAPTLGSGNSSKIHGKWRFYFFPKKVFPKFRAHPDLHIYRWDFCFMKKKIHQKSHKNC